MSLGPKPYAVVYDTDLGLQYVFESGAIQIPEASLNAITSLTGQVTASGPGAAVATLSNAAVIGKVLTGYSSGAGTVAATDTILQAINKLNGNDALKLPITPLASVALTNQSADISSTPLFTASATGLYTIAVYGTTTATDAGAAANDAVTLFWTDDSGAVSEVVININLTMLGNPENSTVPIQVISGQTVSYSVDAGGSPYGASTYSLYIVARPS